MAKKNTDADNGMLGLGEISTIRNILMGQQINEFEGRFGQLEQRIDKLEKDLVQKIDELRQDMEAANANLNSEMHQKLSELGNRSEKNLSELDKKFEKINAKNRRELGRLFGDFSKKLLTE